MYVFVIKVAGILEAFNKNISMEDAMFHGHWRRLKTAGIYCHQKSKKVDNITVEWLNMDQLKILWQIMDINAW